MSVFDAIRNAQENRAVARVRIEHRNGEVEVIPDLNVGLTMLTEDHEIEGIIHRSVEHYILRGRQATVTIENWRRA